MRINPSIPEGRGRPRCKGRGFGHTAPWRGPPRLPQAGTPRQRESRHYGLELHDRERHETTAGNRRTVHPVLLVP